MATKSSQTTKTGKRGRPRKIQDPNFVPKPKTGKRGRPRKVGADSVTIISETVKPFIAPAQTVSESIDQVMSLKTVKSSNPLDNVKEFIKNSPAFKPASLFINDEKWQVLVRNVIRERNILVVGPHGCGKTQAALSIGEAFEKLGYNTFVINLGATQDPRSSLIGNTHYRKETGTVFQASAFVKAISTPNTIIILDEVTRANSEAWNILMSCLDKQRYLRLDEADSNSMVRVAKGVCFIGTANIGAQYTATNQLDAAMKDRFMVMEVEPMTKDQEAAFLHATYPDLNEIVYNNIAEIAAVTREEVKREDSVIQGIISTRMSIEFCGMVDDGINHLTAAENAIFNFFSNEGGNDSERSYIKKIFQKYVFEQQPEISESIPVAEQTKTIGDLSDLIFSIDDIDRI